MDTNHGQESLFRDWLNDLIDTHPAYTLRELASFLLVPESTEKTHQAVAERLEEYAWAARMAVSWLHLAATKPGEVRAQMPTAEEAGPPA